MIKIKHFIVIFLTNALLNSCTIVHLPAEASAHNTSPLIPDDLLAWINTTKNSIQTKKFFNGLTAITARIPNTGRVHIKITYPCGSKNEFSEHEYGLAHLVEHMIFKGTTRLSEGDIKAIAQKFCSRGHNAATGTDTTTYYFDTDAANWPIFLDVLIDCMYNCVFSPDKLASEVKAVVNELTMRNDSPSKKTYDAAASILFPICHPYHHPLGGNQEAVCRATADDLKAFYIKHYHPSKALLTITGDIDHDIVTQEVEQVLRKFDCQDLSHHEIHPISRDKPTYAIPLPEKFVHSSTTYFQHVSQPSVTFLWTLPADTSLSTSTIDCLTFILQRRIEKELIDNQQLVYADGIYVRAISQSLATLLLITIYPSNCFEGNALSSIKTEQAKALCTKSIYDIIKDIQQQGPTTNELNMFKQMTLAYCLKCAEHETLLASVLTDSYLDFGTTNTFFDRLLADQQMSPSSIQDLCLSSMLPHTRHEIIIMPVAPEDEAAWLTYQAKRDTHQKNIVNAITRETAIEAPTFIHQLGNPKLLEPKDVQQPDAQFTLNNGLRVLFKKRTSTPFITIACVFNNGELFNLYTDLSTKAYTKDIAFRHIIEASDAGTKEEFKTNFSTHGATYAFSENGASMNCLRSSLNILAPLFFKALTTPRYPEKALIHELKTIKDDLTQSYLQAGYRAPLLLRQTLTASYPWEKSHEQICTELANISREDIINFHTTYIKPSMMTAVVIGNTDETTVRTILEQATACWNNDPNSTIDLMLAPSQLPQLPPLSNSRYTQLKLPEDQMITLLAGRLLPEREHPDELPLRLLEAYVNKRLFDIRESTGLFYSISICLTSNTHHIKDIGCLQTQISPSNLAQAKEMIEKALKEIAESGIPEDELTTAQQTYSMHLAQMFASNNAFANYFSFITQENKPWSYLQDRLAKVKAITKSDVDTVAQIYLDPSSWFFIAAGRIPDETTP